MPRGGPLETVTKQAMRINTSAGRPAGGALVLRTFKVDRLQRASYPALHVPQLCDASK
jgi:hypothetical protein